VFVLSRNVLAEPLFSLCENKGLHKPSFGKCCHREIRSTCSTWTKLSACHVWSTSIQSMPMLRPIILTTALTHTTSTSSHYQWHRLIVLVHLQNSSFEFVCSKRIATNMPQKYTQLTRNTKVAPPPPPPPYVKFSVSNLLIELCSCGIAYMCLKELLLKPLDLDCMQVPLLRPCIIKQQTANVYRQSQ
jgi:hypothetical protein